MYTYLKPFIHRSLLQQHCYNYEMVKHKQNETLAWEYTLRVMQGGCHISSVYIYTSLIGDWRRFRIDVF